MALTVLEIVVVGADGLKSVHLIQDLLPYPVAIIRDDNGIDHYDSENKKTVDVNGGSNPVWRVLFEFEMDTDEARQKRFHLIVRLESHRKIPCFGSKLIGEVCVPVEELLNDFGDADEKKSTTRRVLNEGKDYGSLTFTYKFRRTLNHPPPALPQPAVLPLPQPVALPLPLPQPQPEPAALPQPANGNPVAQNPQRHNNDDHVIVRAAVGGAVSGLVTSLSSVVEKIIFP